MSITPLNVEPDRLIDCTVYSEDNPIDEVAVNSEEAYRLNAASVEF